MPLFLNKIKSMGYNSFNHEMFALIIKKIFCNNNNAKETLPQTTLHFVSFFLFYGPF